MSSKPCTCRQCGNSHLYYQLPTNIVFKAVALKIFWCHKCESRNYVWGWNLERAY